MIYLIYSHEYKNILQKYLNIFNILSTFCNLLSILSPFCLIQINSHRETLTIYLFDNILGSWKFTIIHNAFRVYRFPKRKQRMLKATRDTPATVPQLQSFTSALLLSCQPPPFPRQSRGNSRSPQWNKYSIRRVPHDLIRRCQADLGSKTQKMACHLCIIHLLALHPEGHLLKIGF